MEASDVIALAALVVAVAGLGIAAAGLGIAVHAAVSAHRSAKSSARSADEAARSRVIDEERRRDEREERHDGLAPKVPAEIKAEFRPNERLGGGHGSLFGSITMPRGYRVKAEALMGQSRSELGLGMVAAPGREVELQIEPWHPDQEAPRVAEIEFRFWPPLEGDDVPSWSCGCGRPTGETLEGRGHWEQRVRVDYYRVQDSVW